MLKPASSSSSSARCWAIVAAVLIPCAAHVELVQGGERTSPPPRAPKANIYRHHSCPSPPPFCDRNPSPRPPLAPTPPADVPPAGGRPPLAPTPPADVPPAGGRPPLAPTPPADVPPAGGRPPQAPTPPADVPPAGGRPLQAPPAPTGNRGRYHRCPWAWGRDPFCHDNPSPPLPPTPPAPAADVPPAGRQT